MTTYTILATDGEVIARHLSLADAAIEVLTYDGHEFDIRPVVSSRRWLWVTPYSRNSPFGGRPMIRSVIYSDADTMAEAMDDIYHQVVDAEWSHHAVAVTDEQYDRLLAEADA